MSKHRHIWKFRIPHIFKLLCSFFILFAGFLLLASFSCLNWSDENSLASEGEDDDDTTGDDDTSGDVWTDSTSGLMWQNFLHEGQIAHEWDEVKSYCPNLSWGGYSDWRLPTIDELRSLIRGCSATETGGSCGVTDSCLDSSCFDISCYECLSEEGPDDGCYWPSELNGDCSGYWSSSAVAGDGSSAWFVHFDGGSVNNINVDNVYLARCVR